MKVNLDQVKIRKAKKEDFDEIRKLVIQGLFEVGDLTFDKHFLSLSSVQIFLGFLPLSAIFFFNFTFIQGLLLYSSAQAVAFFVGRLVWRKMNYNEINSDFQSVTAFCKNYFYSTSCGFWVAEQSSFCGKEIVGTVGIHQPQNRRIDQLKENNFSGGLELRRMSVKKEFRGSGVASMLFEAALDHAKRQPWRANENPALVLGTTEFHLAAIRFYKRCGFDLLTVLDCQTGFIPFKVHVFVLCI